MSPLEAAPDGAAPGSREPGTRSDRAALEALADSSLWDRHAPWWKATFTAGADVEYEDEVLPLVASELGACRVVADVGCGEGQVARRLVEAGVSAVIGIDPSAGQLVFARGAWREHISYLQGVGERLPLRDRCADGVLCCLSIEHARDVDAVLAEAARVLSPGGRFLLLVNHPLYQGPGSGFVDDEILGEHYWRVGRYLEEVVTMEQIDATVTIPFSHRPLSRYVNPLAAAGLVMTQMFEPVPPEPFLAASIDPVLEASIPRLLAMRFERFEARR